MSLKDRLARLEKATATLRQPGELSMIELTTAPDWEGRGPGVYFDGLNGSSCGYVLADGERPDPAVLKPLLKRLAPGGLVINATGVV